MSKLNVRINGKFYEAQKGQTILEVCRQIGIDIPTLCYDPRLEPYSSCYVCVVQVEGMKGMQPSCSTKVNEGMVIETDNQRVREARRMALNLLVSNHYADCAAPCKQECPAGVDVQGYISLIEKGLYSEAVRLIKQVNPLPAICGRVCVRPCEIACRRNLLDEKYGVGIDYLKRFAADNDLELDEHYRPDIATSTGKKVAVIGAGPGGLSSAYFLQQKGHQVDIYEANPKPGGMLRYGIPEYRLPNNLLDKEISTILELGVNIFCDRKLGSNLSYKLLKEKYDSVILTIGSQAGTSLRCPGDDAENVISGIDFLRNMEMTGKKMDFSGKKVAVVGGGNTAMDCCRTAKRCGAENVYVIYRRAEEQMPANPIEIHESKLEGIEYMLLTNPAKVNKDENGLMKTLTCIKMRLGEPDKSGRQRPIPIEGSEFDLELDYVLAAIGQKTKADFIDDINQNLDNGELKLNRWGDIDAKPETLQTSVENIFAAGDGVTGPATLIEAIAQAKIASRSCHQLLSNEPFTPEKEEFLSKKDNFKKQVADDYLGHFEKQKREEMPTLAPEKRNSFNEVELGYSKETAHHEVQRCLECGCVEYFTCELKKHATEYQAEQKQFKGEFKEYKIDFSHPLIEIDNNKCVLCSRCIRICREIVGAAALGLVERGFDTFVAPSMGDSLLDSSCETCGMCIETCPTAAISENVPFKPGPVKCDTFETISPYGSTGEAITIHHKKGFVMRVSGANGIINKHGNISRQDKFGYNFYNDTSRICKPMYKENGEFKPISFKKAADIIAERIKSVQPDQNAFFAGARLTNEEQYAIQKLARTGAKTNNIGSFHYLGRGMGYRNISEANVPFDQIGDASKIFIIGSETNEDNPVAGFMINAARNQKAVPVELITIYEDSSMLRNADNVSLIESVYDFLKAVNYYYLANNKQNQLFIDDNCENFDQYKEQLLAEDFDELVLNSGIADEEMLIDFAEDFYAQQNAILVFSEREMSANECIEACNLALITGKLGKTASGIISLKEKNNAHGLIDMGCFEEIITGNQDFDKPEIRKSSAKIWNVDELPEKDNERLIYKMETAQIENLFIFGEDPIGCAGDREQVEPVFDMPEFMVVQDYFMTETAKNADLILPASFHFEIGGSFTNTLKNILTFDKIEHFNPVKPRKNSLEQLKMLHIELDSEISQHPDEIFAEAASLFPKDKEKNKKFAFIYTDSDNYTRIFEHGCDIVEKRFQDEFEKTVMQDE